MILVTGFGTLDSAVEAAREGAWDFISKPFKVQEVVAIARRALEQDRNNAGAEQRDEQISAPYEKGGLLGRSPVMIGLYKEIARVAPTRSTILIVGESGAGKELVGAIDSSTQYAFIRAFVAVNCGALTGNAFGSRALWSRSRLIHGAVGDRKGLWEELPVERSFSTKLARRVRRSR